MGRAKEINLVFNKQYPAEDLDGKPPTRSYIDLLTTGRDRFECHSSESGWNLPQDDVHHLLKFPAEILEKILEFTLVAPRIITPLCVSRKWPKLQQPSYQDGNSDFGEKFFARCRTIPNCKLGNSGLLHTKHEIIYRSTIDATVLRVCKTLHDFGRPLLYGKNIFTFNLDSKVYDVGGQCMVVFLPYSGKSIGRANLTPRYPEADDVQKANLYDVQDPLDLPGWMCCDPLARFLHSIGPTNASYIRNLKMIGSLFRLCDPSTAFTDEALHFNNLHYYIKAYAPFITLHCPNLDKFNIFIKSFNPQYSHLGGESFQESISAPQIQAQYEEIQPGDDAIDHETLYKLRAVREEMRLRQVAEHKAKEADSVALILMPLIEEITSKMRNLRTLEVTRYAREPWNANNSTKYNKKIEWNSAVVEMDIANDAKLAIAEATRKRKQDYEGTRNMEELRS